MKDYYTHYQSALAALQGLSSHSAATLSKDNQSFIQQAGNWHFDYRYNLFNREVLAHLTTMAETMDIPVQMQAMREGEKINYTENRAVLHPLLRQSQKEGLIHSDFFDEVESTRQKMRAIVESIHSGEHRTMSNETFTDVIAVGIGGSYLGPRLAYEALCGDKTPKLKIHFLANVDYRECDALTRTLDPKRTLVIIASKSLSTPETLENAKAVNLWLRSATDDEDALSRHLIAVTSRTDKLDALGIRFFESLPLWDWVGGRFSVWSAIGLPIALGHGYEDFAAFLKGAETIDKHFFTTPIAQNVPALMALLTYAYGTMLGRQTHAILSYHHGLRTLADFLQQLDMESNGKHVGKDGKPILSQTAPVTWGSEETNAQHSFHQLLHQGTTYHPCDIILPLAALYETPQSRHQQDVLIANALAQRHVLFFGQTEEAVKAKLLEGGMSDTEASALAPHKAMPGRRPSNLLLTDKLDAESLGELLAIYEHRTAFMGWLFTINSFDQWGVELGKIVADDLLQAIQKGETTHDEPPFRMSLDVSQNKSFQAFKKNRPH